MKMHHSSCRGNKNVNPYFTYVWGRDKKADWCFTYKGGKKVDSYIAYIINLLKFSNFMVLKLNL